ncbi:hypothetical protein LJC49_05455 [Ruminococcaceae bacterium OttesenSCG-928-I18]|nr:hypothetical protein [Ruminococcaceae bacterium OttesenSCG-928-I18]
MGIPLGGIDAYLDQMLVTEKSTAAKNTKPHAKVQAVAPDNSGVSSNTVRRDGFAPAPEKMVGLLKSKETEAQESNLDYGELIKERLEKGERLSDSEMKYLRNYDPALYQKAKRVQDIRDKFSELLQRSPRNATQKIHREVLGQAQKARQTGDRQTGEMLVRSIEKEYRDFVRSPGSDPLPSASDR